MNNDKKIVVKHIAKVYRMYNSPIDRFKEAVSLKGTKLHSEFHALKDISFSLGAGEILGIVGCNGAGKSTLLKIITGVLTPTSGDVLVTGKVSSLLELGAGFNPEYTGIENIFFYGTLMGLTRSQVKERLDNIIAFAEIGDYIYHPVKTYSSGMFARLAFACAINVEPDILIVDEILSVGDIRFQAKCFNRFKYFKEKGVTIIYVGHDVSMMKSFCDRAIWINQGCIQMDGDPAEVAAKYVEFMYLTEQQEFDSYRKLKPVVKKETIEISNESKEEILETEDNVQKDMSSLLFPQALAHWGTHVGMIRKAFIRDIDGKEVDHFSPADTIIFGFEFEAREIDFDVLSVAISIKNKEGTDIIVKTSYDEGISISGRNGYSYHVEFKMKTYLAVGEYYFVIALENRTEVTPMYYEYIDGALYFKVFTDKKIYGKLDIPAQIRMYEV